VTKEELDWKAPFELEAIKQDNCHAFVVYFDMWFTSCKTPVHFSTGPHANYTHWKQTVFYLDHVLLVREGDKICGTISAKPNQANHRDIDIAVHYKFDGTHNSANHKQIYFLR